MNRWLIIGFCGCLVCILAAHHAVACDCGDCGGVILELLDGTVRFVSPGQHTTLRASASDYDTFLCYDLCNETQEITDFSWSFPSGIQHGSIYDPCPCEGGGTSTVEVWSGTPGVYYVSVGAGDNDGHYSSGSFTIWVIDVSLDIIPASVGIGEVADASLSWSPSSPPGCFALYTSSQSGGGCIRVYADQGKTNELLSLGPDTYINMASRFPHTVWVEGVYSAYAAYLYFDYCPSCTTVYPLDDWGEDSVRVVQVQKVVDAATSNEGPLYVVCQDDTIQLQALPWPSEGPWPSGEPHWEFVSQPGAATITPSSGSDTVTVSGFNVPGEYIVKAKCGRDDVGDEITIITPPPVNRMWDYMPPFHCPPRSGEPSYKVWPPDSCGNEISIICDGSSFYFYYKPATGVRTQVGQCIWENGENEFYCWLYEAPGGRKRFLETHHVTANDAVGVDSDGEGCQGFYCWRVQTHNCVTNSEIGHWWRRDPNTIGWNETSGQQCLGENGLHRGYPN